MREISKIPVNGDWDALKQLGFVQGKQVNAFFYEATLPEGWSNAEDDGVYPGIVDGRGFKRVQISYKEHHWVEADFFILKRFGLFTNNHKDKYKEVLIEDRPRRYSTKEKEFVDYCVYREVMGSYAFEKKNPDRVGFFVGSEFIYFKDKWLRANQACCREKSHEAKYTLISLDELHEKYHLNNERKDEHQLIHFVDSLCTIIYHLWREEHIIGDEWSERNDFKEVN